MLSITAGPFSFTGELETERAPKTVAAFERLLPFHSQDHPRRAGAASRRGSRSATSTSASTASPRTPPATPRPGQVLWYPGGLSETEILFPYGGAMFASIVGQLAGNHFLTIVEGIDQLRPLGEHVLWKGALDIVFERSA